MLRASTELSGQDADLRAVTDGEAAAASGIDHGAELAALAEAIVGDDEAALARARARLDAAMGPEALVDAVAVAANFERMVRIADGTGIPLDPPMTLLSQDIQEALDLARFGSAANTPALGIAGRLLGPVVRPLAFGLLRTFMRRRNSS